MLASPLEVSRLKSSRYVQPLWIFEFDAHVTCIGSLNLTIESCMHALLPQPQIKDWRKDNELPSCEQAREALFSTTAKVRNKIATLTSDVKEEELMKTSVGTDLRTRDLATMEEAELESDAEDAQNMINEARKSSMRLFVVCKMCFFRARNLLGLILSCSNHRWRFAVLWMTWPCLQLFLLERVVWWDP